MRIIVLAIMMMFASSAKADTLTLWTETVAPGQSYGLNLCQFRCSTNLIATLGTFIDTGQPVEMFFSAEDSGIAAFIAYIANLNPDPWTFIFGIGNGNMYGGHFDHYPIPAAIITGMFISSTGDLVNYGVTGTSLVPEPGTWAMLLMGLLFTLRARLLQPEGR